VTLTLPYAHLNLRRNPFGEPSRAERAGLAVVELGDLLGFLRGGDRRAVQLVGDSGRGKTTHLLALEAQLGAPYQRVLLEGPAPRFPRAALLLVDELQHLRARARRRLYRRARSLVAGTHEDLTPELTRAGYEVETVCVARRLTPDLLREILARRLEWARRGPGPLPRVSQAACVALVARFGDDVRAIEHLLYERIQGLEGVCDVEV
jgi:hypothetical protein